MSSLSCAALTLSLLRLSVDLISKTAGDLTKKNKTEKNVHHKPSVDVQQDEFSNNADDLLEICCTRPSNTAHFSFIIQCTLAIYSLACIVLKEDGSIPSFRESDLDTSVLWYTLGIMMVGIIINIQDWNRQRLGIFQKCYYGSYSAMIFAAHIMEFWYSELAFSDIVDLLLLGSYMISVTLDIIFFSRSNVPSPLMESQSLSRSELLLILKPYFWPQATMSSSATRNRVLALLTWVCVFCSKACTLSSPFMIGAASKNVVEGNFQESAGNILAYGALQFGGSLFKELQGLLYMKVSQEAFVHLSDYTFNHIHKLSLEWHLHKKTGEVIRSMDRGITACDTLMKHLFLWVVPAFAECIVVCVIFATYFDDQSLAVITFYWVFFYAVVTILLTIKRKKFRKKKNKSDNEWHEKCTESLVNFEIVKYFTAEEFERKRFTKAVKDYQHQNVNFQTAYSALHIGQQLIFQACLVHTLIESSLKISKGSMDVGAFVTVLAFIMNLFQPLNYLARVYSQIVTSGIDLQNLSELLAQKPDIRDIPNAVELPLHNMSDPEVAVEFDNVSFHYPTQPSLSGLNGLSFKLKRGTSTAIVGSTGSGKTTIGRLLLRLYDTKEGSIKVNGMDVKYINQKSLRNAFGVVPQMVTMFNDTLESNIRYSKREATDEELQIICEQSQLWGFIQSLPEGWNTLVGDRGLKLSGGEMQRAAIARCLIKNPSFVLLDEATSALDNVTERSVQQAIDRLSGSNRTSLIIAHRLGTIQKADNIIVLNNGRIVEEGTHRDLLDLGGIYTEMWKLEPSSIR